jgi:chromosome segregation ATPase
MSGMSKVGKFVGAALAAVTLMLAQPADGWSLIAPTNLHAQPAARSLDALRRDWADLQRLRAAELAKLERLEGQYQQLADKIASLKRRGQYDRGELEALLRQGKKLAEELDGVQAAVRALDDRIEALGAVIASRLDALLREIERGLATASGQERANLVRQLNAISQERARYAQPVPRLDRQQVDDMLKLADRLDSPDDMIALADELQDAEADVRARLDWVSKRLDELRARQRLIKRARTFAREESFFEEGDRSRVVARVERQTSPAQRPTTASPPRGDQEVDSTNASPNVASNASEGVPHMGISDGLRGGDRGNEPPTKEGFDSAAAGGSDDVYGGSTTVDVVVVAREADPASASRRVAAERGGIDEHIRKLEQDEAELKRQAEALRRRAAKLRAQAAQN